MNEGKGDEMIRNLARKIIDERSYFHCRELVRAGDLIGTQSLSCRVDDDDGAMFALQAAHFAVNRAACDTRNLHGRDYSWVERPIDAREVFLTNFVIRDDEYGNIDARVVADDDGVAVCLIDDFYTDLLPPSLAAFVIYESELVVVTNADGEPFFFLASLMDWHGVVGTTIMHGKARL